jgi:hypothetical protein
LEEAMRVQPSVSCAGFFRPVPRDCFANRHQGEEIVMTPTDRRTFLGVVALGAGGLVSSAALAAPNDGHAAGYDVAPSSSFLPPFRARAATP